MRRPSGDTPSTVTRIWPASGKHAESISEEITFGAGTLSAKAGSAPINAKTMTERNLLMNRITNTLLSQRKYPLPLNIPID